MARDIPTEDQLFSWFETLSNWGRWGADDELGTLNLITDEKRAAASRLVQDGVAISLARTIRYQPTSEIPLPPRHFMTKSGEGEPPETVGRTNHLDTFLIPVHGKLTHLDAPSHTAWRSSPSKPWAMYNGRSRALVRTTDGATAGSIELAGGGIVGRGILLDIARSRGVRWLAASEGVFPEDLEAAEEAQGVRAEAGDIVFVRTGFPGMQAELGSRPASEGRPGMSAACLPWLRERDIAVFATDGCNDVEPGEHPGLGSHAPIHGVGMAAIGLWLLDSPELEELGEACAARGRWTFQAIIAPLKLHGGTGSPVNPIALL